jgi:hypothetical protein
MDASIVNRKDDRKEMSYQEMMEARLEYEEPCSGDIKDAGRKSTAYHKATERDSEKTEPDK